MNIAPTMDLVLFSMTIYVGFYYLALYLFRKDNRPYLHFSLVCFAMAVYDLMTIGLYTSGSIHAGAFWQKGQFFCVAFIAIGLLNFIYSLLELKSNRPKKIFLVLLVSIILLGVAANDHILAAGQPMVREIKIFHQVLVYHELKLGLLFNALFLVAWIGMIYYFNLILRAYVTKNKRDLLPFMLSVFIFFLSAITDTLISLDVILFLYTIEYAFFLMIIVMDFTLQKRFVKSFAQIETFNIELEHKVVSRTSELKEMADRLSASNKLLEEKNAILASLAERDAMTKLYNHVAFLSRTSELLSLAKRQNICIAIIIMDIDHFKNINDTYGHLIGDQVIIRVAETLHSYSRAYDIKARYEDEGHSQEAILRQYDTIGRYGGDEFAIALPFCKVPETQIISDRIAQRIGRIAIPEHPELALTVSLGCAVLQNPGACEDELQLMKLADQALYTAKKQGRNQSVILTLE